MVGEYQFKSLRTLVATSRGRLLRAECREQLRRLRKATCWGTQRCWCGMRQRLVHRIPSPRSRRRHAGQLLTEVHGQYACQRTRPRWRRRPGKRRGSVTVAFRPDYSRLGIDPKAQAPLLVQLIRTRCREGAICVRSGVSVTFNGAKLSDSLQAYTTVVMEAVI